MNNYLKKGSSFNNTTINGPSALMGVPGKKYRPINYELLQNLIVEKKKSDLESHKKIKSLQKNVKLKKDENILKQHRLLWNKEMKKIYNEQRRLESEINVIIFENVLNETCREIFNLIEKDKNSLNDNLNDFKKQTINPVVLMRNDLKDWMNLYFTATDTSIEVDDPDVVMQALDNLCGQQYNIIDGLLKEMEFLESELNISGFNDLKLQEVNNMRCMVVTGIPEAAFSLECSNDELKIDVLQEFIQLDGRYVELLQKIEEKYSSYKHPQADWSLTDHQLFAYLSDLYSSYEIQNRRTLYFDIMHRYLAHKSTEEIIEHEKVYNRFHFYCHRLKQTLLSWQQDRAELFNKAAAIFEEALNAQIFELRRKESADKRRKQAKVYHDKLQIWREKKMELQQLESLVEEERRREMEEIERKEQQEQIRKKEEKKLKIREFHDSNEKERNMRLEFDKRRMQQLQKTLAEQAVFDKERIKFREDEFKMKEEAKSKKKTDLELSKIEKEKILEKIREKVRPKVGGDLMRLWSNTETWKAKIKSEEDNIFVACHSTINTFTSDQVLADPRFRLEQRLRDAGVHTTSYARQALASTLPLHPPRKDMISNIFKEE